MYELKLITVPVNIKAFCSHFNNNLNIISFHIKFSSTLSVNALHFKLQDRNWIFILFYFYFTIELSSLLLLYKSYKANKTPIDILLWTETLKIIKKLEALFCV